MNYRLHPQAAAEHTEHVAYYEARQSGLGVGYDAAFRALVSLICEAPHRHSVLLAPDIRRVYLRQFPYSIIFRGSAGGVQILAIAHHRRRPGYWLERLSKNG